MRTNDSVKASHRRPSKSQSPYLVYQLLHLFISDDGGINSELAFHSTSRNRIMFFFQRKADGLPVFIFMATQ